MSRVEADLNALASLSPAQLRAKWISIDRAPPPGVPASLLIRLLAQRLQERRYGGLSTLIGRELARLASEGPGAEPTRQHISLTPGTRLVREWNGRTISVEVLEGGFAFEDQNWRSLSEIARHVTGAHWSGPRFFGLAHA